MTSQLLKLATLPSIKTLEGYDFAFASGAPRKHRSSLALSPICASSRQ